MSSAISSTLDRVDAFTPPRTTPSMASDLRRVLLRGLLVGLFFGLLALAADLLNGNTRPDSLLVGLVGGVVCLTPVSALEIWLGRRAPSWTLSSLGGLLALPLGGLSMVLMLAQVTYASAMLSGEFASLDRFYEGFVDMFAANPVSSVLLFVLCGSPLAIALAVRLSRLSMLKQVAIALFLGAAIGLSLSWVRFLIMPAGTTPLAAVIGFGMALSIPSGMLPVAYRVADGLEALVARRLA